MARLPPGCLKWLLILALGAGFIAYVTGEFFFNLSSNLVAITARESKEPLEVRTRGGWKRVTEVSVADVNAALVERHREEGFRWSTLTVRRKPDGIAHRIAQGLFGAEVEVVWIAPENFDFATTYKDSFALTTAAERMEAENLWFSINANFRDPAGKPLGWVVHESRQVHPPFPKWTGCFFVKGGKPWFGPKSLLDEIPGEIEEGTQGYPSVMKDHTVFSYVDLQPDKYFDGKKITYRSLGGVKRDGSIVFVLSGDGGVMNVSEVSELAKKLEVRHATLLDGGRALQYSIRTGGGAWHFHAFNTALDFKHRLLRRQRSPVYIGVRRRAPEIVTGP
jgi:uncharacterized protein YigE (DUF2233 family)